jgi:hypothetical protein
MIYGFLIGEQMYTERGKTEQHALINLIKHRWEAIDAKGKIELLGEEEEVKE